MYLMKKVIVIEKFIFHYYKGFKTVLVFSLVLSMTDKRIVCFYSDSWKEGQILVSVNYT